MTIQSQYTCIFSSLLSILRLIVQPLSNINVFLFAASGDVIAMVAVRYLRKVSRVLLGLLKCDLNAVFLISLSIVVIIVVNMAINVSRSPTILTDLDKMNIDISRLQQESKKTILIEQNDGEVFVAFHIKDSSSLLDYIKNKPISDVMSTTNSAHTNIANKTDNIRPVTLFKDVYNINNAKMCASSGPLSHIVLVHSATQHFMRRASIRETWANQRLFRDNNMRIVFLLGMPEREATQTLIEHETMLYKDVIQGKFLDSYSNLTHKGVLGLRWVSEHCQNAKFVVKVDDDVFLNVFKLMEKFEKDFQNKTRHIWCPVRRKGTSPIQRKEGKWRIDDNEFKNMTHYPVTYCNGFVVVLTSDIISEMYKAAQSTPFFWVDDVYVFGMLPDKIGGVQHIGLPNLNLNEQEAIRCFERKNTTCPLLVANAHSDGVMDKLWYNLIQQHRSLAEKYSKESIFKV